MNKGYGMKFWLVIVGIIVILFGIVFICQYVSPDNGIVIDKNFEIYKNSSEYKVLVKSEKWIIPVWIRITQNYYDILSIGDIYYKNENSFMYSFWLEK